MLLTNLQICSNLYFLGKRTTTKTSEGIKIVTLGGQLDTEIVAGLSKDRFLPFHTTGDAKSLFGANTADILLTTSWPAKIRTGSSYLPPTGTNDPTGLEHISELCAKLKPRYHLSVSPDFFYEREPFFHIPEDPSDPRPLTRFISLAAYGNSKKQKAIYGFNIVPGAEPSSTIPPGATASPFTIKKRTRDALDPTPYTRFSTQKSNYQKKRRQNGPPPRPDECFFCLSNQNLAQHLISSIGDDAYLTTAKGPLTTSATNASSGIAFPAHVLIIPLVHSSTLDLIAEPDAKNATYKEMNKYKSSLQNMVAKRSEGKLGAVTYEVSRAGGVHTHWQFLPVDISLISKGLVEAAFRVEAENLKYPDFEVRDPGVDGDAGDFFRVWIWSPSENTAEDEEAEKGTTKCLTLPISSDFRFDLQFGRKVLAKLLGLENRFQWRDVAQTEEQEKKDVAAFKNAFKEFDFSL